MDNIDSIVSNTAKSIVLIGIVTYLISHVFSILKRLWKKHCVFDLVTEIEIEANASDVFQHLTDFEAYQKWNPFIVKMEVVGDGKEGKKELKEGCTLRMTCNKPPPEQKDLKQESQTFEPQVIRFIPQKEITWKGNLFFDFIFQGVHTVSVVPIKGEEKAMFIQKELFQGAVVPLVKKNLDTKTRGMFESMNISLKKRVEA